MIGGGIRPLPVSFRVAVDVIFRPGLVWEMWYVMGFCRDREPAIPDARSQNANSTNCCNGMEGRGNKHTQLHTKHIINVMNVLCRWRRRIWRRSLERPNGGHSKTQNANADRKRSLMCTKEDAMRMIHDVDRSRHQSVASPYICVHQIRIWAHCLARTSHSTISKMCLFVYLYIGIDVWCCFIDRSDQSILRRSSNHNSYSNNILNETQKINHNTDIS